MICHTGEPRLKGDAANTAFLGFLPAYDRMELAAGEVQQIPKINQYHQLWPLLHVPFLPTLSILITQKSLWQWLISYYVI